MTAIGVKLGGCGDADCMLATVYNGVTVQHGIEGPAWTWLSGKCPVLPTTLRDTGFDNSDFKTAKKYHEFQRLADELEINMED